MDESPAPSSSLHPGPCSRTISKYSNKTVKSVPNGNSPSAKARASNTLRPPMPDLVHACLSRTHLPGDPFSLSRSPTPAASLPGIGRDQTYLDHADSDSIMGEVQDRIRDMEARLHGDVESVMPRMTTCTTCKSGKSVKSGERSLTPWVSTMDSNGHGDDQKKNGRCFKPTVRFRPAVILTQTLGALLACTLMFVPLLEFSSQLMAQVTESYQSSLRRQFDLVEELTSSAAFTAHSNILERISTTLWDTVLEPPDRALDAGLGFLETMHTFQPGFTGISEEQRAMISFRSLAELKTQHAFQKSTTHRSGMAEVIYVGFTSGEFAGASLACADSNCTDTVAGWYDCPYRVDNAFKDHFEQKNVVRKEPQCSEEFPTHRPWFTLQSREALLSAGALKRMWSGLYVFMDGTLGFTKTAPVAFCGNYSCFQGVVAADISLPVVSRECREAFRALQQQLQASAYSFTISSDNSAVFVVSHQSRGGTNHTGWLIGSSGSSSAPLSRAEDSPQAIVRSTARALLHRYGSWDATPLQEQQRFRFRAENVSQECGATFTEFTASDCIEVGTVSVKIDEEDRWLVVLVSPSAAFHAFAHSVETSAEEEFEVLEEAMESMGMTILRSAAIAFLVTMTLMVAIGCCLGAAVGKPLKHLTKQLRALGNLECLEAEANSSIRDINEVQLAFCRLSHGIETFARFVPEPVVRNIIKGDGRASRLHVARREVTILFSDIKDFTSISESMDQIDLICLLTRYLSIMSRIVETFGGVVAEILGDGLLVYWNTPLPVQEHEVKACAAAVAMQQALEPLNYEMSECGFPNISVRIGINTGHVLSGTFGSDKKMKFGCMGDPVNVASRLEGLCKTYGVGIICSSTTYEGVRNSGCFVCRELDLVQVKGRREAVMIFEVMGADPDNADERVDLDLSEMPPSDAGSRRSSPSRSGHPDLAVGKTFSRESGESRFSRKSHASRVSEMVFHKSPSQAALDALEDSRQSLTSDPRFNWQQVLEQKKSRMAQKRNPHNVQQPAQRSTSNNPASPGVSPCPRVSFALPPPAVSSPDTDKMRDLARHYEMVLHAYQGERFEEASDLAQVLLTHHPNDSATKRLLRLAKQGKKAPGPAEDSAEANGPWSPVSVMLDKE